MGLFEEEELEQTDRYSSANDIHDLNNRSLKSKMEMLDQKRRERIEKLRNTTPGHVTTDQDIKNKLDKPAYARRNVNLDDVPHSSERQISKFNLNDDNQILGNNKFLHDNVD